MKNTRIKPFFVWLMQGCLVITSQAYASDLSRQQRLTENIKSVRQSIESKSWVAAEKQLNQLQRQHPKNLTLQNLLAVVLFNQHETQAAQVLLTNIIESTNQTQVAYQNLKKIFSYSAAMTYSQGLQLLAPVKLPILAIDQSDILLKPIKVVDNRNVVKVWPIEPETVTVSMIEPTRVAHRSDGASEKITSASVGTALTSLAPKTSSQHQTDTVTSNEQVAIRLGQWVKAWQAGDYKTYINSYSVQYKGNKKSRHQWLADRKLKVSAEKQISVTIENIDYRQRKQQITTTFIQHYRSKNYADKVKKRLYWKKQGSLWSIQRAVNINVY